MSWIHSQSSGLLQRAQVTSVALPSAPHSLSSQLRLASLHCCCCLWSSYPMVLASPKCWGLLLQLGCTFTNSLSWNLFRDADSVAWSKSSISMTPSILGFLLHLRTQLHQGPFPVYHNVKPPLLSMTLPCLQNLGNSFTLPSMMQAQVPP